MQAGMANLGKRELSMEHKLQVTTPNAPTPAGPYSQGIVSGGFLFVAGQRPQDPVGGTIPADIRAQTAQVISNIEAILAVHGCTLADVVRSTVYLSDIGFFNAMNEIYSARFPAPYPARTTMGVQLRGIDIEIDVIARIPKENPHA